MIKEQMMVLRMLEEGRITADQAVGLLEALGQKEVSGKTAIRADDESMQQVVREEQRRARQAVRKETARAREIAREVQAEVKGEANHMRNDIERGRPEKTWGALGALLGGGKNFSFTRNVSGQFSAIRPDISVRNTNGRIDLGKSNDEKWHLRLLTRVRAADEAGAQALAEKLVHIESDDKSLTVQAQRMFGQNASVTMELLLPAGDYRELSVITTNGSVELAELTATKMEIKTINGKVRGEKLQSRDLQASSVNGSVAIDGVLERVQAHAANGRLSVSIADIMSSELDLKSVNGSIVVELPEAPTIGYELDIATTSGSVKHGLSHLIVNEEQKRAGRRKLVAASANLAEKQHRQIVKARSVSGSVKINV